MTPAASFATAYLADVQFEFRKQKSLADKAIAQVEDAAFFHKPAEFSNSIAIIAAHLAGNMRSRWTDFLNSDGEKPWRNRDAEFERQFPGREELLQRWNEGWDCFLSVLDRIEPADLERICYIRNEGHTVMEAINREFAHYAYHVGQIVFAAKQLKSGAWKSLSIPKNRLLAGEQSRKA